jgi:hypothetical protein
MVMQVTSLFSCACVMSISDKGLMLRMRCAIDYKAIGVFGVVGTLVFLRQRAHALRADGRSWVLLKNARDNSIDCRARILDSLLLDAALGDTRPNELLLGRID